MCKQTSRDAANVIIDAYLGAGGKIIECKAGRRNYTAADINAATRDAK